MHIFVHLLNDFSGSPRIINEKIASYRAEGADCFVITNGDQGFIRVEEGKHRFIPYRKHGDRFRWAVALLLWHLRTFLLVLRIARRGDVLHASTMLTSPHLLAARLKGARTVSHLMETRVSPALHKRVMCALIAAYADGIVYLSQYVEETLGPALLAKPHRITYPCVDPQIIDAARGAVPRTRGDRPLVVGQVCSLVWHKGYREFIALAGLCPEFHFILVLNGDQRAFEAEYPTGTLPPNVDVRFNVRQIATALKDMDVLVSLTRREGWIETFGLTLIEGMSFALPVIAPDVGAPREFVEPGKNGFLVDESSLPTIARLLRQIGDDPALYQRLSEGAGATASHFTPAQFHRAAAAELAFFSHGLPCQGEGAGTRAK